MSYLVIARKWRPQSFADIVGQEHITRTLQNAIRAQRIAHAFLFTGVRGVGKTTAARILAKALNCEKGPTPGPCGECTHCEEIAQGRSIDVLEIDGASNRGIDEIRQIIENVRYQPAKCRFKIYIIDEVHQVTKDAFNALLKTLEEPPPSVKFILATTEPHRLPATILSRCQRYDFRRIKLREIAQRLSAIAKAEAVEITEGALMLLAHEADGSMRDAQSLLEQVLAFGESSDKGGARIRIDERSLHEVLGLAERQVLYQISAAVLQGDAKQCLELITRVFNQGCDLGRLARDLVEHFRNLLVARLIGSSSKEPPASGTQLLDLPDQEIKDLIEQAGPLASETLLDYFDYMAASEEQIARSTTPRFVLETALVHLANLPKTIAVSELIGRLESLEQKLAGKSGGATMHDRRASAPFADLNPPLKPETIGAGTETNVLKTFSDRPPDHQKRSNLWEEFLAFVGTEKRFLFPYLESAMALGLPPEPLKISIGERYHLAFWQDDENLAALKGLAKRFFSTDVTLQIVGAPSYESSSAATAANLSTKPDEERSPMVKEALRIFGGSVRNVRRENG
ncbi:MAG TPA: DNA polymerase III subunit gamma/tau [Candidatus Binatia bacterium]